MKEQAIIFDLDGTLAEINHRVKYVEQETKDWKSFYERIPFDNVNVWCLELLKSMKNNNYKIIIVTGRGEKYASLSKDWLKNHDIFYDEIYFRKMKDRRADQIIKQEIYEEHIKGKYDILFVVDDRLQVVEMWRMLGLVCLQCDWGDF